MYGYHLIKFVIIIQEKTDCILSPHKIRSNVFFTQILPAGFFVCALSL